MKKRKIDNEHKYNHITVSASHVYNYMNNDHLVDWLRIYRKEAYSKDNFTDYICNKGNDFEEKLIDYIHKNKIEVQFVSKFITQESCEQAVAFMMQGVPLLFSVPVKNTIYNGIKKAVFRDSLFVFMKIKVDLFINSVVLRFNRSSLFG